jgi:mannitol/fructose-specific phosphotransferase system IIA component (Ntr-type)
MDVVPSDIEGTGPNEESAGFRLKWECGSAKALRHCMHTFAMLQSAAPVVYLDLKIEFYAVSEQRTWSRIEIFTRKPIIANKYNRQQIISELATKLSRYDLLTQLFEADGSERAAS